MAITFPDDGIIDIGEEHFGPSKCILSLCIPIFLFKGYAKNCL